MADFYVMDYLGMYIMNYNMYLSHNCILQVDIIFLL